MRIMQMLRAPAVGVAVLAMGACNILDVTNPNDLVEENIRQEAAASAVANGSLALVSDAVSGIWQPYLVASDEMHWIGSRDAWFQLDQGFLSNPNNEFTDGVFDNLGRARWMSDEAIEILEEHVANKPANVSFKSDLARANLYSGIIYTVIGEVQEDFAFSDKLEAGPPVGPANMSQVLDGAIERLTRAISLFGEVGNTDGVLNATAMRARAHHSRAIWSKINPTAAGGDGYVSSAAASADAAAVITMVGGVATDWSYAFTYSSSTIGNDMAGWVNDRKENQFDPSLVTLSAANDVTGVALQDPIDNIPDPVVDWKMGRWKGGSITDSGNGYAPLDLTSSRLMHLILAEDALANGNDGGFTTHINHVRDMDGLTRYSGQIPARDMLLHERRVNLMIMGLRLADMYRFGVTDPLWQGASDAIKAPGTMLPITITEIRANCHMNGQGC